VRLNDRPKITNKQRARARWLCSERPRLKPRKTSGSGLLRTLSRAQSWNDSARRIG
jgi:hypothetical protein